MDEQRNYREEGEKFAEMIDGFPSEKRNEFLNTLYQSRYEECLDFKEDINKIKQIREKVIARGGSESLIKKLDVSIKEDEELLFRLKRSLTLLEEGMTGYQLLDLDKDNKQDG